MKRALLVSIIFAVPVALSGCSATLTAVPTCGATERLGLIAQSVPSSLYVPCVANLPAGWRAGGLVVENARTSFDLTSDRASGHPVHVDFRPRCDAGGASAIPPRTPGGTTFLRLYAIAPRYSGVVYDVFPGGCVTYAFNFQRGPHIAQMAELTSTVAFVPRSELRLRLQHRLDVELRP